MPLSDIVSVNISANTVVPSRVGFGTPLIFDYHTRFTELFRKYSDLLGMAADGFVSTDPAYMAAKAIFSQNPKVTRVIVGRTTTAPTQVVRLTPIAKNSTRYNVTINGITYFYDSDSSATVAEIVTGLVAAMAAVPNVTVTNVGPGTDIDLTGAAGILFTLSVDRTLLTQIDRSADPNSVNELAAIQLQNDDWYSVHPTLHGKAIVVALAAQIETMAKILITESADDDILSDTEGNIGDLLNDAGYVRTALMYHRLPHEYSGAAWAGKLLPLDPGSATWKFKSLAGIDTDVFTPTQVSKMEEINVNYYSTVAGVPITQQGKSASGQFIDLTQGIDWLAQRLKERIFGSLVNVPKLPFTDQGIAIVEADVRAQLQEGIGIGFIAAKPDPIVTVPAAADVSSADKASRTLNGVKFSATLAGAIHQVSITGTVTV